MSDIFSIREMTVRLSAQDLSKETGIPLERVKAIRAGKEPFISEIMALSKYTGVGTDVYFSKVIFGEIFRGHFISGNYSIRQILKSGDPDAVFYLANSGLLSRKGDDVCFSFENEIDPVHPPDRNLVIDLIKELLKNDQPHLAVKLSVKNSFYGIKRLSDSICSYETLKAYLFDPANRGLIRVFAEFFNGLDNDTDKEKLLTEIKEKLELFDKEKYIIKDGNKLEIARIPENGILNIPADKKWSRYDFTKLNSECILKSEIIELQDKLFEKGMAFNEVEDIAKNIRREFLTDIRKEAEALMNCDDELFQLAGLYDLSESEKSSYRERIRVYAAERIGSRIYIDSDEEGKEMIKEIVNNDSEMISRAISCFKDHENHPLYKKIVKLLGEKSKETDKLFLTRLWLLKYCDHYQMIIRDVYKDVLGILKSGKDQF